MNKAVANTQQAGFKHARSDAAVTAHGIVAASAERAFHLAAGMAATGKLQQDIADTGGNDGQVFLLYQGDLTRAVGATTKAITREPC